MKTMMRGAQTSLRPLKPPIVRAPNWGKLSQFRGSFLLTRSNEKLSAIMTLFEDNCKKFSWERTMLRELDSGSWLGCSLIAIRSSRGCPARQAQSFRLPEKEHIRKGPRRTLVTKATSPGGAIFSLNFFAIIAKSVPIPGFFSFVRVSRTFRAAALSVKREFLGSKGPSVFVITSRAKRSCFFFDVEARVAYRTKIQMICGRVCIGISSGFLIQQSLATDLMLTNPMTSQRVDFPQMLPGFYIRLALSDKCIYAHTMPQRGFLAVAVCTAASTIHFCRSGDNEWSFLSYDNEFWSIRDIIVFARRIYALMDSAHIGLLCLRSPPTMHLFHLKYRPRFSPYAKLVVSVDELLAVDFVMDRIFQIYRVDLVCYQWVRILNLGDRSLFLSEQKSSRICSTASWGGRANVIYYIGYKEECLVYSATNPPVLIDRFPITPGNKGRAARVWYGWYMPNEALKMDCVCDQPSRGS